MSIRLDREGFDGGCVVLKVRERYCRQRRVDEMSVVGKEECRKAKTRALK